jgi:hypothetical protein
MPQIREHHISNVARRTFRVALQQMRRQLEGFNVNKRVYKPVKFREATDDTYGIPALLFVGKTEIGIVPNCSNCGYPSEPTSNLCKQCLAFLQRTGTTP